MKRFIVESGQRVAGELVVPGDKSISHRALMLGAVAEGPTVVRGFLAGDDCLATMSALEALGVALVADAGGVVRIEGKGPGALVAPTSPLDLGNSGTAMRLFAGLLAGTGTKATLTGDASLCSRPMERIAKPLRLMGASIETTAGHAPISVAATRSLTGIEYRMPVASAQIKSALLLATLGANGESTVHSPAVCRDHTERMLATMGAQLVVERGGLTVRLTGPCRLEAATIDVPGDISSAAFFLVAGCLGGAGDLVIRNVGVNPTRTGILTILETMGAEIELHNRRDFGSEPVADLVVRRSELKGIDVPEDLVPLAIDELPVLFIAAAAANGQTRVTGASELRHKESDRIGVMARALSAAGIHVEEQPDGLMIEGGRIQGATIDCHGDHRVAMAFAVAALAAEGTIEILRTDQVATSFPGFANSADAIGLHVDVEHNAAA